MNRRCHSFEEKVTFVFIDFLAIVIVVPLELAYMRLEFL